MKLGLFIGIIGVALLPRIAASESTTEVYETLNLGQSIPSGFTKISVVPSSSIAPEASESLETTTLGKIVYRANGRLIYTPEPIPAALPTDPELVIPTKDPQAAINICDRSYDCNSTSTIFSLANLFFDDDGLTCFHSANACSSYCSGILQGECYDLDPSDGYPNSLNGTDAACNYANVVCFYPYSRVLLVTMILTTIALVTAIIAGWKLLKSRRSSPVVLKSFTFKRNDFRKADDMINEKTVRFDSKKAEATIQASTNPESIKKATSIEVPQNERVEKIEVIDEKKTKKISEQLIE